jgi:hypothetical protein
MTQLTVEREQYKGKDGKQYWAYMVRGEVRGRAIKVDFAPKDRGGYEPLDIVFDVAPTAALIMTDEEMTDTNGRKIQYTAYKAQNTDENGITYECGIKPAHDSDKSLLTMLLNTLNKAEGKANE